MEDLLEIVKSFLDITGTDRDEDIQQIIEDALNDMARVGILILNGDSYSSSMLADPQVIGCVKLYARYMVNYDGDADRYLNNYMNKRNALSLHEGYYAGQ